MSWLKRFWIEEEGAEVSEWALLVVVLAMAVLAGGPTLTTALNGALGNIGNRVSGSAANLQQPVTPP